MAGSNAVFRFTMSDLARAFGRSRQERERREKEEKFLKGKFAEWELNEELPVELTAPILTTIITDPEATQTVVQWGEKLGAIFKSLQLTSSQIRGIFGTVRQIEMAWRPTASDDEQRNAMSRLLLLKPKLAYQAKRQKPVEGLQRVLSSAIDFVGDDRDNFQRFVEFFEAIVAYHTAAGGQ